MFFINSLRISYKMFWSHPALSRYFHTHPILFLPSVHSSCPAVLSSYSWVLIPLWSVVISICQSTDWCLYLSGKQWLKLLSKACDCKQTSSALCWDFVRLEPLVRAATSTVISYEHLPCDRREILFPWRHPAPLPQRSLSLEERCVIRTSHFGLRILKSLSLSKLISCRFMYWLPYTTRISISDETISLIFQINY